MHKKLKICLFFVIFFVFLTSCVPQTVNNVHPSEKESGNRFEQIYYQEFAWGRYSIIYKDKATGIEYLFVKNGYGGGLTKLEK